jgi:hypothetical protein
MVEPSTRRSETVGLTWLFCSWMRRVPPFNKTLELVSVAMVTILRDRIGDSEMKSRDGA